ncbi:hypothetical protein AB0D97_32910 [Streptomyces roseus]|uniref:hypothetical protein n=1 Tax=Streptomyces roseus TaxID=66430 RepID=UPI0033C21C5E
MWPAYPQEVVVRSSSGLFGREIAVKEILIPPGTDEGDRAALVRRSIGEARATVTPTRHVDATGPVPGVNFEIEALDDAGDPARGASNAARFVAGEKVLGGFGPLNSGCALPPWRPGRTRLRRGTAGLRRSHRSRRLASARVGLDGNGDTLNRKLTVYAVRGGSWTAVAGGSRGRSGPAIR